MALLTSITCLKVPACRGSNDSSTELLHSGMEKASQHQANMVPTLAKKGRLETAIQVGICLPEKSLGSHAEAPGFQMLLGACLLLHSGARVACALHCGVLHGRVAGRILLEPSQGRIWPWRGRLG